MDFEAADVFLCYLDCEWKFSSTLEDYFENKENYFALVKEFKKKKLLVGGLHRR